jgi:hypothetical protein
MKYLIAIVLLIVLSFTGCKKNNLPESYFTYKDKTYELNDGILEYWGSTTAGEGYNFDISLFSSGLYYDTNAETLVGSGEMVYFETFSPSDLELSPGTYYFNDVEIGDTLTFDKGQFWINLDIASESGTLVFASGGNLDISVNGAEYELTFECETSAGNILKGFYKGGLDYYDRSVK